MRFGSISLLSVVGILGVSCGGAGGGPTSTGNGTPGSNNAVYQTPPSTYEPPAAINPKAYEPPPGTYDAPPGQTTAGGVGTGPSLGSVWNRLCNEVLALNCDFAGSSGADAMATAQACEQAGSDILASLPCPDAYAGALACILDNITITCDLFTNAQSSDAIDPNIATTCQAPILAFAQCAGSTGSVTPPMPTGPCQLNNCRGCAGPCDTCLCENNDAATCTTICANQ